MNVPIPALVSLLLVPLVPAVLAQQMDWTLVETENSPSARRSHAMVYDQANKVVVLFGGYGNGSHLSDTWALDLVKKTWKNMKPVDSPSPRAATTMVYDPVGKQSYLFGGFGLGHSVVSNETWAYDYASNAWTMVETAEAPGERASYGMALDSKRHELVLFGGFTESGYFNDVWIYDIAEKEWRESELAGTSPSPRGAMSFSYNPENDYFVMFGGFSNQGFFSDTWVLDTSAEAWLEITPENSPPPVRSRMVYYDAAGVSTFFGGDMIPSEGHQGSPVPYGKTWAYDAMDKTWTEISTDGGPSPRALNGIAYDSDSKSIVIFGGTDTLIDDANFVGHEFQDTWVFAHNASNDFTTIEYVLPIAAGAAAIGIFAVARKTRRKTAAE